MSCARNRLIAAIAVVIAAVCIAQGQATTCYSCEGQACLRTSQENVTKLCSTTSDQCVTKFSGYVPTKKGCYADLTTEEKMICDAEDNVLCYKCAADRCNRLGRIDHKCKDCIATNSNSTCLFAPEAVADTRCVAPRTQDVYCSVKIVGNATHRGCVTSNRDILDCINAPATCSLCNVAATGACNAFVFPASRRQCQYCSGDNCELVNATTTVATLRTCPLPTDRCVSVNHNGVFKRLCAGEINTEVQEYCTAHNTSCVYCTTNGCNVAVPPNGASALIGSITMVSLAVLAAVLSSSASSTQQAT